MTEVRACPSRIGPRKYRTRTDGTLGIEGVNTSDDDYSSSHSAGISSPCLSSPGLSSGFVD